MFPLVRLQSSLTKALSALDARIDQEHEIDRAGDRNFGLEYMLGGLQSGELIVFAGRPFMGRTALVHHIAIGAAADRSIPVLVVSPEHDATAVSERLLVAISGVNSIKFRIGMTSVEERVHIDAAAVALSNASLWIDETPAPRLRELERRIMRWRRSVPGASALVVIDSLSLVDLTRKRGGKHPLAKVARRLKGLAVAARIALIVVAEVGEEVFERADRRPVLRDLRPFALERVADRIAFMHRPEVFEAEECPEEDKGMVEVLFAKNRGPRSLLRLAFDNARLRFKLVTPLVV